MKRDRLRGRKRERNIYRERKKEREERGRKILTKN